MEKKSIKEGACQRPRSGKGPGLPAQGPRQRVWSLILTLAGAKDLGEGSRLGSGQRAGCRGWVMTGGTTEGLLLLDVGGNRKWGYIWTQPSHVVLPPPCPRHPRLSPNARGVALSPSSPQPWATAAGTCSGEGVYRRAPGDGGHPDLLAGSAQVPASSKPTLSPSGLAGQESALLRQSHLPPRSCNWGHSEGGGWEKKTRKTRVAV